MRVPRSVTMAPIAWPWRSLKFATDLRALRISAFWPATAASSSAARSRSFAFWVASPRPTFSTTFETVGTWWMFV
jgi:hypothetical protein